MKKLVSIVIPAYNEEQVLDELEKRLKKVMEGNSAYDFEVIIVENGSWDSSFKKLMDIHRRDTRFKVIQLSRNFGLDGGIAAGLENARGDAVVIMNADLQDPPEMIPMFLNMWEQGYEVVYGIIAKRKGVSATRELFSSLAYKIIHNLGSCVIPENVSDFRLLDKKVYTIVNRMGEKNKFMRGIIAWTGFRQTGIAYERPARYAGDSKIGFFTAFNIAMNGIFSFSYVPLHAATLLGFLTSLASFAMILAELYRFIKYGREVPGFTTTIILILMLFGILFLILGVVGIYISRIYDDVKQRPNFIVKEAIGIAEKDISNR